MKLLDEILAELEEAIKRINSERESLGLPVLYKVKIRVLGQFSLLADKQTAASISLAATVDLDALIEGDWIIEEELRRILRTKGLVLDELSREIWIPEGSEFLPYYESSRINCIYLDPFAAIVSKAVKAREKNRILVRDAIDLYGQRLIHEIRKYGIDPEYFTKDDDR
jgi:hypothetical protein